MPVGVAFSVDPCASPGSVEAVLCLIFQDWHSLSVFQVPTLYNFSEAFPTLLNSLAPSVCSFPPPRLLYQNAWVSFLADAVSSPASPYQHQAMALVQTTLLTPLFRSSPGALKWDLGVHTHPHVHARIPLLP